MRFLCAVALAAGLVLAPQTAKPATTEGSPQTELFLFADDVVGLIHSASIEVVDKVEDGCWTNIAKIRTRAFEKLEAAGIEAFLIPLTYYSPSAPLIQITGWGTRESGFCFAGMNVTVAAQGLTEVGNDRGDVSRAILETTVHLFKKEWVITSDENVNEAALNQVTSALDDLIVAIQEARRKEQVKRFIRTFEDYMKPAPPAQ